MNSKRIGRRTVALQTPPSVLSFANIGGRMEGQGPLAKYRLTASLAAFSEQPQWRAMVFMLGQHTSFCPAQQTR